MDVSQDDVALLARETRLTPTEVREALDILSSAMAKGALVTTSWTDEAPLDRTMATAWSRWTTEHPIPR